MLSCKGVWWIWIAWCAGRVLVCGLLEYPSNWDTLTYHLPLVDGWLDSKTLYAPSVSKWFFPGNNELLALWMVAPFSGDFFGSLNNVPSVVLLVVCSFHLIRLFRVSRILAHVATLALVSNYVVSHQLLDNKNDVSVVGLAIAGLFYGMRYSTTGRALDLMLTSLSVGLLSGIKYYALAYSAIVLVVTLTLVGVGRGCRQLVKAAVALGGGAVVWGGYWYGRNYWVTGSPVYPESLWPGDRKLGASLYLWQTTILGNDYEGKWGLLLEAVWRMTGPCHIVCLFILPWCVLSLCRRVRLGKEVGAEDLLRPALAVTTIGAGIVYLITPFTIETVGGQLNMISLGYVTIRLGLVFFSLIIVCAVVSVSDCIRARGQSVDGGHNCHVAGWKVDSWHLGGLAIARHSVVSYLLLGLVLFQTFVEARIPLFVIDGKLNARVISSSMISVSAVAIAAALKPPWLWWSRRSWPRPYALGMGACVAASLSAGVLGQRWHTGYSANYDLAARTQAHTVLSQRCLDGTRICVLAERSYPFYGSRRQWRLFQAHNFPAQPTRFNSSSALLDYLRHYQVSMIAVTSDTGTRMRGFFVELTARFPDMFTIEFQDDGCELLRLANLPLDGKALEPDQSR
jgi:hypothetical protein